MRLDSVSKYIPNSKVSDIKIKPNKLVYNKSLPGDNGFPGLPGKTERNLPLHLKLLLFVPRDMRHSPTLLLLS